MITRSTPRLETPHWQKVLSRAINDPKTLIKALNLSEKLIPAAEKAAKLFPLKVTEHYLQQIEPGNINDPLLQQVLPLGAELEDIAGYSSDPVGDMNAAKGDGILQKYAGRALVITTGACAIHCRYCFRRHYPYNEDNAIRHWPSMLGQLSNMTDINEVILSGGDPLSLSDHRLQQLIIKLNAIPHLRRLRIHTRLPLVLPERITDELTNILKTSRLSVSLVLHCNHKNELSEKLTEGLNRLRYADVSLLNQSVLLANVNNNIDTLCDLSEALFDAGVLPYYIHLLDKVSGSAHFATDTLQVQELQQQMVDRLPGYLVPKFVHEESGAKAKTAFSFYQP